VLERIAAFSGGDARAAYNTLEAAVRAAAPDASGKKQLSDELLADILQRKVLLYDKAGEEHYNIISALHKSVRNSDPDAALYWLARMLEAGEDPLYIARRMVRMASEDIGLAEPGALAVTIAAMQAVDFLGMPEGNLALAQAAVYLSLAPKSNAVYVGYGAAAADIADNPHRTRASAFAQRGDRPDEKHRLRQRLSIRARTRRRCDRHDLPARKFRLVAATTSRRIAGSSSGLGNAWRRFGASK
jgi:replication-associated recombination protein RarA